MIKRISNNVGRIQIRFRVILTGLLLVFCSLISGTVNAGYHAWDINEIYSNGDGSVQFIELRALGSGQQFVSGGVTIRALNASVTNSFTCNSNLPADTGGRMCLFGTANLASVPGGVAPNYIIPPNFIPTAGSGSVVFSPAGFPGNVVTASFGNLPTDGNSAVIRSGASFSVVPTNSPRSFANQSNSIVPLEFLSTTKVDDQFVLSFKTATGVNATPGPNYALESLEGTGTSGWTTISNLTGNGAVRTVGLPIQTDTNKIFRLRVP